MSNESAESLVFWACPLIVNPAIKAKKPLNLPPFPAIDLSWDGFTIPRLHWAGINVNNLERREAFIKLAVVHEYRHLEMAATPFLLFIKHLMLVLYGEIITTFQEKEEVIDVPITADQSCNDLQEILDDINFLIRKSKGIEEIFAIRSSLSQVQKELILEHDEAQAVLTVYKEGYGRFIPKFANLYNAFDCVAERIGDNAAAGLIYSVLGTAEPLSVFSRILFTMCRIAPRTSTGFTWTLPKKITRHLENLSSTEAFYFFSRFIDDIDPDGSRFGKANLLKFLVENEQVRRDYFTVEDVKDDLLELVFGASPESPKTILFSGYYIENESSKLEFPKEVDCPHFLIFLEAIMQQLITGIGLLCPFWACSPQGCCGGRSNRALLEKVWRLTAHNCSKRSLWRRPSCLDQ